MKSLLDKIQEKKLDLVFLLLVSGFLIFWNLHSISLWSPDEPRFAAIVRHMIRADDYFIPKFNGHNLYWKPILVYWLMALPAKIAGDVSAFTSRLPSALSAIGIILAFYFFLRMFWKKQIAFFSSLILITNYTFLEQARLAIIDMALTLFMFLALLSFIKGYMEKSRRKTQYSLFSVFCGLAMLSKGPIGVIVPCGIVFLFLLWEHDLRHLKEFVCIKNILLFLVVILPWYAAALYVGGREFFYEFIIRQNIIRFFKAFDHIQPFYYYIDRVITHFFPWSLFLPAALLLFWKDFKASLQNKGPQSAHYRFMIVWAAGVFLLFSFSKSKRSQYILLLYPVISFFIAYLWAGFYADRGKDTDFPISSSWILLPGILICLSMGIFFIAFPSFVRHAKYFFPDYLKESIIWSSSIVVMVFTLCGSLMYRNIQDMGKKLMSGVFCLALIIFAFMVVSLYPQLDRKRTAVPYAKRISEAVGENRLLYFYLVDRPEFVFYLNRGPVEVIPEDGIGRLMDYLKEDQKTYCLIIRRFYNDRHRYLKKIKHKIVLDDLKGWKWDYLLISN